MKHTQSEQEGTSREPTSSHLDHAAFGEGVEDVARVVHDRRHEVVAVQAEGEGSHELRHQPREGGGAAVALLHLGMAVGWGENLDRLWTLADIERRRDFTATCAMNVCIRAGDTRSNRK